MVSASNNHLITPLISNAVWHGTQEKYQIFDTLGGRFNSEFGMEAFPHISTIDYFVENPADKFPQSQCLGHIHPVPEEHVVTLENDIAIQLDLGKCVQPIKHQNNY